MIYKISKRVTRDEEGATLVEFAIIAPVFFMLLMGIFDFGHITYVKSILNGAVQEASRNSALENAALAGNTDIIDDKVRTSIQNLANSIERDDIEIERASYFSFDDVNRPEAFTDSNGDSDCNNNEVFEDENANGQWDADIGEEGLGGARDVVVYNVAVTYDRLFPLYRLMGMPQSIKLTASTVLQNQPYAQQADQSPVTPGNCI
ncbi:TadE/TadG family type IV pilus assembly protein [Parasphingorhabdus sp.]|jgi:Flp pilus assembly pilin Flp|uniref:TadE/TadG family type IV pilus assembly protein n=1 Tax=Parasphingorhabdus sp. TaxID=2709688 RepID=UPI0030028757